jgi:hypothetical protein
MLDTLLRRITRVTTATATIAICSNYHPEYAQALIYTAISAHLALGDFIAGPTLYYVLTHDLWSAYPLISLAAYSAIFCDSETPGEFAFFDFLIKQMVKFIKSGKNVKISSEGVVVTQKGPKID